MFEQLKKEVYKANIELVKKGLVLYTWGNVSAIDEERKYIVIKPSGVDYDEMTSEDMVVVDMDGNVVEGKYRPSSDTKSHLEIYKAFINTHAVAHTHSTYATSYSQAAKGIIPMGTTHADYFYGEIPCTRALLSDEIKNDYELNTGKVIIETFLGKDYNAIPACLVRNHGPFTWGDNAMEAVFHSVVLEEIAKMAFITEKVNKDIQSINKLLLDKHFKRKHGQSAYYGQTK
ncbi:MAG: L-ribulose-5-phosphate 4-epimerase [Clostridia bacterium]|jgi:L-ribulose-5-phosphate 4-epimerase|nr:L-ribulose-5-phosphate 4-epimerase [Clostridia bacterium]MDD4543330.1 L-ribulose-5-phosphate 4-epimerase [Clostridia bacterium]